MLLTNGKSTILVDSALGLIPQGWQVKKLGYVIEFQNCKAVKVEGEGNYPIYGSNGIIGRTNEARYQNGIIIGRVGAYCGSLLYCKSNFWASDNTIVAKSKSDSFVDINEYQLIFTIASET